MRSYVFAILAMFVAGVVCSERAVAQDRYDGVYLSFGSGVSVVKGQTSPIASLRVGAEYSFILGEAEVSYLSMKQSNGLDHKDLSTMTVGVNLGMKFIQSDRGYLAAIVSTGYSLQEDWHRGYDCCFYDYYCYNYGCDGRFYRHHEKPYFGFGLSGAVDITSRFGLYVDARYQTMPFGGRGKNRWGWLINGGVRFYF